MTRSRELPAGTVLDGKWRLGGLLGDGGTATVYEGAHVRNGLAVAVKVLRPELAQDLELRARFLSEGYAANRVEHPGAVRVLDDGTTQEGVTYLVMERLHGVTLDALAAEHGGALPVGAVLHYAVQLCEVMAHAHARGIVHRDLKPENVFLATDGSVKVLDFGIAKVHERTRNVRLTVQDVSMGTPAFMPPEQALGRWDQVDARSDVYAVGASLFNVLSGRLVHEGTTVQETMVLVSTRPAPPIASRVPGLPPLVALVIDRALSQAREARFEHAGALAAALKAAIAGSPGVAVGPLPLPAATARPSSSTTERVVEARAGSVGTLSALSTDSGRKASGGSRAALVGALVGLSLAALATGAFLLLRSPKPVASTSAAAAPAGSAPAPAPTPAPASAGSVGESAARASSSAAPPPSASVAASGAASTGPGPGPRPIGPRPTGAATPGCERDPFTLGCKK